MSEPCEDEDQLNRGRYAEENFWDDRIAGHRPVDLEIGGERWGSTT